MTTAVATRPTGSLALPTTEPRMTPRLRAAVEGVLNPHPDVGLRIEAVADHTRIEAEAVMRLYDGLCAPTTEAQVSHWLMPVNAVVRNPLQREEFDATVKRMCVLLTDLPASVFTVKTQKMAMAAFQFWPAAADIHKLLYAEAAPIFRKRDALRKVIAATVSPPDRVPPTDAERQAVTEKLRAHREELEARRPEPEKPRAKASYVTGAALAALRNNAKLVRS